MAFTSDFLIFYGIIGFSWIVFLFEFYLSLRQRKVYHETTLVPHEIAHSMDIATFEKSKQYSLDKNMFSIFKETVQLVMNTILLVFNGLPYFWYESEKLGSSYLGYENEIVTSCIFIVLFSVFSTLVGLPLSLYHHFVLEEKHGFNKQTYSFFVKDQIKSFIVSLVLTIPLTAVVVYIIQVGGNMVFLYLWAFIIIMSLFLMTIYPEFIAPLFDKYTPLPDGDLKTRIEQLSASLNFPLKKLYVVEGSKRSEHSNAYFYGFFKNKRIVLFDTLLKDYVSPHADKKSETKEETEELLKKDGVNKKGCDTEEVLAILAHELGHWKYNHVLKSMIVMQINLLFMLYSFQYLFQYKPLYSAFGFYNSQPILLGLIIVLQYVFAPYNQLVQFLMTCMTRCFEFQADAFGKSLGKSVFLRKALLKLNSDNLGFPVCDWMFSLYHNSHPPLLERLQALDKDD